ncbi:helix-turn-helix domain-containing protein [Streptomyces sp. NPDC058469]|uniref:helix-turn-helix domain-containing protein n=1 Tax=Streptomyces sp. NPDC058469 TaxID=3346514 RepID=UPI00365B296A
MPPRTHPTARQLRLGAELRKLREATGVVSSDAAKALGTSQAQISNIEAGKNGVSQERLRRLAEIYGCEDAQLVDALVAMATDRQTGWWEEYRGVLAPKALDIAEMEHHGSDIRTFQAVHIPGVLQTEDHMRAASIFAEPTLSEATREAHVSFRTKRRAVLESGILYDAIVHEAALRMRVGGTEVARAQLEHLVEASERENLTIRVIPFSAEGFAGAGHPMQYVSGVVPQLDTVQIDTIHGAELIDAVAQLGSYKARLELIGSAALAEDASLALVRDIAQNL